MPSKAANDAPLFAERPEWADVQPLEQYEITNPIAPIFYSPECEHVRMRRAVRRC